MAENVNDERPTHLDLFSGIGGFALAARWAGFRTVGFCEIDKYCQRILWKNFNRQVTRSADCAPIWTDIRNLDGRHFRGVDLVTGGFPCQPFSVAGKRRGKEDNRHLWPEMLRVIKESEPTWILGENVTGIINMELDTVLSDLEDIGYSTRPFIIPACGVDAPHRRNRVWIVAYAEEQQGSSRNNGREQRAACDQRQSKPRRSNSGGMQWCNWLTEPDVGRVANGIPSRVDRLKGLGNAIVPQVAYQILKAIREQIG